jgi:hypothetical protein
MHLAKLIESMSLFQGIFVIAAISALIAFATSRIRPPRIRWGVLCGVPVLISYCLYWLPVWSGVTHSDEYAAWQFVCIIPWSGSGILASSIVADYVQRLLGAKSRPSA